MQTEYKQETRKDIVTPRELLISGAGELGIFLTDSMTDRLFAYAAELEKWNRKINLTAVTGLREIVIRHFLDSLAHLKAFSPGPGARLLDMGSGAGFPALPIRIVHPDITITMVESVKKKAAFLRHLVRSLGVTGVEVLDVRTTDVPDSYNNTNNFVTARAFSNMPYALAEGLRFLAPDGRVVLSRGPEETIGPQDLDKAGVLVEKTVRLRLPHSDIDRAIWVFKSPAGHRCALKNRIDLSV